MNTLTPHSAKGALADASGPEHRQLNLPITFRLPRSGEREGKKRGTTLIATSEILNLIN